MTPWDCSPQPPTEEGVYPTPRPQWGRVVEEGPTRAPRAWGPTWDRASATPTCSGPPQQPPVNHPLPYSPLPRGLPAITTLRPPLLNSRLPTPANSSNRFRPQLGRSSCLANSCRKQLPRHSCFRLQESTTSSNRYQEIRLTIQNDQSSITNIPVFNSAQLFFNYH